MINERFAREITAEEKEKKAVAGAKTASAFAVAVIVCAAVLFGKTQVEKLRTKVDLLQNENLTMKEKLTASAGSVVAPRESAGNKPLDTASAVGIDGEAQFYKMFASFVESNVETDHFIVKSFRIESFQKGYLEGDIDITLQNSKKSQYIGNGQFTLESGDVEWIMEQLHAKIERTYLQLKEKERVKLKTIDWGIGAIAVKIDGEKAGSFVNGVFEFEKK